MSNTKNLVKVEVSTGYDAAATSVVLTASEGAKLPSATPFYLTWYNSTDYPDPADDPNAEIIEVTNVATDTLTVTRARQGTSATTKNTAGKTYKMVHGVTAYDLGMLVQPSASSKTIYLDANNGDDSSAKRGHPFRAYQTIGAAFAVLANGDTLIIRAGTYTITPAVSGPSSDLAPLKLNGLSDIKIIGENTPVIYGAGDGDFLTLTDCDHVLIEGVEFRGDDVHSRKGGGEPPQIAVIFAQIHLRNTSPGNTNITINKCKFYGARDHCIGHLFSPRNTRGVKITNCHFERQGAVSSIDGWYDGTSIASVGSDVIIDSNTFFDTLRGVELEGAGPQHNVVISNNTFKKGWELAVMCFATSGTFSDYQGVTIIGNTIQNWNTVNNPVNAVGNGVAIQVNGGQTFTIQGNTIVDCTFGIDVRSTFADLYQCLISGNVIQACGAKPIVVWGPGTGALICTMISIVGNIIHSASQQGITVRAQRVLIANNQVINIVGPGIRLENDGGGAGNAPSNIRIIGNICNQLSGFSSMTYALQVQSQFTSNIVVCDNDFTGMSTAGIDNAGTITDRTNDV